MGLLSMEGASLCDVAELSTLSLVSCFQIQCWKGRGE